MKKMFMVYIEIDAVSYNDLKAFQMIETEYGPAKISIGRLVGKILVDWLDEQAKKVSE